MRRFSLAVVFALLFGGGLTIGMASQGTESNAKPCCFSNPRYSGQCEVTPGADETCSSILSYLNNQSSVGKAYCGNSTIRGGWTSVTCDEHEANHVQGIP